VRTYDLDLIRKEGEMENHENAGQPPPSVEWEGPQPPEAPANTQWSPPQPVTGPAPGLAYAGFLMRFFAYFLDSIVIGIVYFVLLIFLAGGLAAAGAFGNGSNSGGSALLLIIAVTTAFSYLYFVWSWVNWRATPGQRLLNLMVVKAEDGGALTYGRATVRWAVLTLPVISLVLFFITWIWPIVIAISVAASSRKQGVHDLVAKTFVVQYLPGTR
jgi:uncharacterized RDD family membrane protein YckC